MTLNGVALTPRESQIVALAIQGYTAKAIGARLGPGGESIRTMLSKIFRKLGVKEGDIERRFQLLKIVMAEDRARQLGNPQHCHKCGGEHDLSHFCPGSRPWQLAIDGHLQPSIQAQTLPRP